MNFDLPDLLLGGAGCVAVGFFLCLMFTEWIDQRHRSSLDKPQQGREGR